MRGFDGWLTIWKPDCNLFRGFYGYIGVPFWPLILVLGSTLCISWIRLRRRRKRKQLGLCLECGYDLRGSGERCPECGTLVERDRPRLQCEE